MDATLVERLPEDGALSELAKWARTQDPAAADDALTSILKHPNAAVRFGGLKLLRRVESLRSRAVAKLELGLSRGDPQEIGHWLKALFEVSGPKAIMKELLRIADLRPQSLVHAWYHLFILVRDQYPEAGEEMVQLARRIEAASVNFAPGWREAWSDVSQYFGTSSQDF